MFARTKPIEPQGRSEPNPPAADLSESECNAHGYYPPASLLAPAVAELPSTPDRLPAAGP